ncbi:MAG: SulP family inorganic anion transporter [Deltaproteobacteria bacterium]|nr:SulP family inorganic anion transporter [Deltaproteobacteria bacterium]
METMTSKTPSIKTGEKPENGIRGLKHWKHDLLAGMQVSLVSLPLSLGIAIASGAPPVTGIISSVIAGLVYPFIGGAYVTISGPAAGLAPALFGGMLVLGGGNLEAGYPLLLVAISLAGITQLVLTYFRAGRFAIFFPQTVVEAMLAAIGIIIIIKQFPLLLGVIEPPQKTIFLSLQALPDQAMRLNPAVLLVGAVSAFLIFFLNATERRWLKLIPPPLVVVGVGGAMGAALGIGPDHLIRIPDTMIESIRLPAFGEALGRPDLWWSIATIVITLTLIDGIESLATIQAVDRIDPWRRKSDPNRTLGAMGLSNLLSSMVGGLTIIPGGLKSRLNVDVGGRTLWSNFANAAFLLLFFFLLTPLLNRIPLATLAAILVQIGWRLCEPRVFQRSLSTGLDQFLIFVATVLAILLTDLLSGILIGFLLYVLLLITLLSPSVENLLTNQLKYPEFAQLLRENFLTLFRSPVLSANVAETGSGRHCEVQLSSLFNTNLLKLENALQKVPTDADIAFVLSRTGKMICHTAMEYLHHFQGQAVEKGRRCEIRGLDHYHPFSDHPNAGRKHVRHLAKRKALYDARQNQIIEFANRYGFTFSPATEPCLNERHFAYMNLGSDRMERNFVDGRYKEMDIRICDFSFLRDPLSYVETRRTVIIIKTPIRIPDFFLHPKDYGLARYMDITSQDIRSRNLAKENWFLADFHLHAENEKAVLDFFSRGERVRFCKEQPKLYVEAGGGAILAFRVDRCLEHLSDYPVLLEVAEHFGREGVPGSVAP